MFYINKNLYLKQNPFLIKKGFFISKHIYNHMTKIIRLTEADLERIIKRVISEKQLSTDNRSIQDKIKYVRGVSNELKEIALSHLGSYTKANKGKITGLELHDDLKKKIKEKNLPSGFDMGIDKDGYYIHTHRARSKSHESPSKITEKEIKFIDSTG